MNRYDKIPKVNPDYTKGFQSVAEQWMEGYFAVRLHCGKEIFRGEMWKGFAILGWAFFGITAFCAYVVTHA